MKTIQIIHLLLATISGMLLIGYGGMDDSPGAQFLGLLLIITGIVVIIKIRKHSSKE